MFRMSFLFTAVVVSLANVLSSSLVRGQTVEPPVVEWERTYGSIGDEEWCTFGRQCLDGGFILVGHTTSILTPAVRLVLLKTDALGQPVWQKVRDGKRPIVGYCVQPASDGGFIVVGAAGPRSGPLHDDIYLLKTDAVGETAWERTMGDEWDDRGYFVRETRDVNGGVDGFILVGEYRSLDPSFELCACLFLRKTNLGGDVMWDGQYRTDNMDTVGFSIQQLDDGGYVAVGKITPLFTPWHKGSRILLIKVDNQGRQEWQRVYNNNGIGIGYDVRQTADRGFVIVGIVVGQQSDITLLKTDAVGEVEWQRIFGSSAEDNAFSVDLTNDGGYILAGGTLSFLVPVPGGASPAAFYVIKTDRQGAAIWSKLFGWGMPNFWFHPWQRCAIQQTSDGGYAVFSGTVTQGGIPGITHTRDCRLLKLAPEGVVVPRPPSSPRNPAVALVAPTVVQFSWEPGSRNTDEFVIERQIGTAGAWTEVARVASDVLTIRDGALPLGAHVCYRVSAVNDVGSSAPTDPVCATTPLPDPPLPPRALTLVTNPNLTVQLSWEDSSSNLTQQFVVERRGSNACAWKSLVQLPANTTAHTDTQLPWSDQIAYRVAARNAAGTSAWVESTTISHPAVPRWQLMLFRPIGVDDGLWVPLRPCDNRFQSDRGTAVIVHGWQRNRDEDQLDEWMLETARRISRRFDRGVNVLAWEWLIEAHGSLRQAQDHIDEQASHLTKTLTPFFGGGYVGPIHLMGHSNGTHVVTVCAKHLLGLTGEQPLTSVNPQQIQLTLWDVPDLADVVVGSTSYLDFNVSELHSRGVYVDTYDGIAQLGTHQANLWVNVPGSFGWPFQCASGITGHSVDQWYRCTIPVDSPDADPVLYHDFCALQPLPDCLNCTIGFGTSVLLGGLAHRPILPTCAKGTVKFGLRFPCPGVSKKRFIFLGAENCESVPLPTQVILSDLTTGDYRVREDWQPNFGLVNSTEMFFGAQARGDAGGVGGQAEGEPDVRYTLTLDIQPAWDYLSFEYDFTEAVTPTTLSVTIAVGEAVYPVFQMSSDLVLAEGYLGTGLRDIRQLHGQTVTIAFELRSTQPGMVVYLRNLTFWRDPYHGNHRPVANAGTDQELAADATGYASVTLDGSASSDEDGDNLSYWWLLEGELLATGIQPTAELPPGHYQIQLVVRDPADAVSTDECTATVSARFIRADSNADHTIDVSDAVFTLLYLFTGRVQTDCPDAVDANDDGTLDLSDAIFVLSWLFLSATEPPEPGPFTIGPDPTPDGLHCLAY